MSEYSMTEADKRCPDVDPDDFPSLVEQGLPAN